MDELKTRVIANARRIIADRGVSQRELARRAEVPYTALLRYLDMRLEGMTTGSIVALADVLGVDPWSLTLPVLREDHEEPNKP